MLAQPDSSPTRLTQIQNLTNLVMIDFEQSMIGDLDRIYQIVPQKGFVSFVKNIYKRVQHEGLS